MAALHILCWALIFILLIQYIIQYVIQYVIQYCNTIQYNTIQYNVLSEWLAEQLAPKECNAQFYTLQPNLWVTECTFCGCACIQE